MAECCTCPISNGLRRVHWLSCPLYSATPTPQAQAGDSWHRPTRGEQAQIDAAVHGDRMRAPLPQAPARDAGAVAWAFEYCGKPMLRFDKPYPGIPFTNIRPLIYGDTHPAAASDDARDAARYRWLRDSENYPDFDWWADTLTGAETADQFDAAIDAALTPPDGRGEGSA